jgi:ribonucleotide monophosphatase NagD (HAD superfamily)
MVQSVSGKELQSVLFGKPHRTTYEYAIQLITELATQQGHTTLPQ